MSDPDMSAPRMPIALETGAELALDGQTLRLVRVDDIVPKHEGRPGQSRPRLLYLSGEIVHFDLGEHRYALVLTKRDENHPSGSPNEPAPCDMASRLTSRELQIVQLICMGLLTKQVADRLRISEFTVRSYLKTVYCKLGVRSRGAMVFAYAQSFGRGPTTADKPDTQGGEEPAGRRALADLVLNPPATSA